MRRPMGQGTIVPWTPTPTGQKRWRIAVTMPDGKRVWRVARSPREAERIRRQLVDARELDLDPTRQTVAGFLQSWVAGLRKARNQRIRIRTLEGYESIVELHLVPALGALRLSELTPARVQAFLDADAAAPRTVNHHRAVLRRALNVAVRQRLLPYNPAALVEPPTVDVDAGKPLTTAEARRLLEATVDDRLHALWRLAIVTGLRQGELLGLTWDDVRPRSIVVTTQLQRIKAQDGGDANGWGRTPTKAARKVEELAIDDDTVAALARHRARQAAERTPDWRYFGMVFVTERGDPYHPSVIRTRFGEACDAAGIRRRRFHDLRGSSATIMRDEGVTEDTRMARLGHATATMARHYAKASEAQDRDAVERLARALTS